MKLERFKLTSPSLCLSCARITMIGLGPCVRSIIFCLLVFSCMVIGTKNSQSMSKGSSFLQGSSSISVKMPGTRPLKRDTYLCTAVKVPDLKQYIVHFEPNASQVTVHHLLLFGCSVPGDWSSSWDCGSESIIPTCDKSEQILFAWAKEAPAKHLPKDVGFQIGKGTQIKYLVLQIHYASVDAFKDGAKDYSGLTVHTTENSLPFGGGIYLLWAGQGSVEPEKSGVHVEIACEYKKAQPMFAFAYRCHAHGLATVISGYRIRDGVWTLLGKGDPQAPQAFYPMEKTFEIQKGDILAARCTYDSRNHDLKTAVHMGPTAQDEMCNFYIMYYSDANRLKQSGGDCGEQYRKDIFENFPMDSDVPLTTSPGPKEPEFTPTDISTTTPAEKMATDFVEGNESRSLNTAIETDESTDYDEEVNSLQSTSHTDKADSPAKNISTSEPFAVDKVGGNDGGGSSSQPASSTSKADIPTDEVISSGPLVVDKTGGNGEELNISQATSSTDRADIPAKGVSTSGSFAVDKASGSDEGVSSSQPASSADKSDIPVQKGSNPQLPDGSNVGSNEEEVSSLLPASSKDEADIPVEEMISSGPFVVDKAGSDDEEVGNSQPASSAEKVEISVEKVSSLQPTNVSPSSWKEQIVSVHTIPSTATTTLNEDVNSERTSSVDSNPSVLQSKPREKGRKPSTLSTETTQREPVTESPTVTMTHKLISDWPSLTSVELSKLGQVTGVAMDTKSRIVVFHRGSRVWEDSTFDDFGVFKDADTVGTIKEHTVWIIDSVTGKVKGLWGKNMFYLPHGLTIDHEDNMWLTDVGSHQVFKFSPLGSDTQQKLVLGEKLQPGTGNSHFCMPTSVAVERSGNFFVADGYCNSRILKYSADGKLLMKWGELSKTEVGVPPAPSTFIIPHGLALDQQFHILYVADRENGRVQAFRSSSGEFIDDIKLPEFGTRVFAVDYSNSKYGSLLHVVNGPALKKSDEVAVQLFTIRLADKAILDTWPRDDTKVLTNPHDLISTSDGTELYIGEIGPSKLHKLSTRHSADTSAVDTGPDSTTVSNRFSNQKQAQSNKNPLTSSSRDINSTIVTPTDDAEQFFLRPLVELSTGDGNATTKGNHSTANKPENDALNTADEDDLTAAIIPALVILSVLAVPVVFLLIISILLRVRAYRRDKQHKSIGLRPSKKDLSVGTTRGWWSYMNCCDRQKYKFKRVTLQDFYSDSDSDGV